MTGLVGRVAKRGLVVVRVPDGHDRRSCQVTLTALGERVGSEAHADVTARLDALTEELPPRERQAVASAVTRIVTA